MTRPVLALLALLFACLLLAPPSPRADESDEDHPHRMVGADGEADLEKCDSCHEDDLTLLFPKEELCLICHTTNQHPGSAEHVAVKPEGLARTVPRSKDSDFALPLTDDGGIFCGTCHLYHDPADPSEPWLAAGAPERTTPFAAAVRGDVERERDAITNAQAAHFARQGTRALRAPVAGGALCAQCHEGLK
jgi:hypothetical protein